MKLKKTMAALMALSMLAGAVPAGADIARVAPEGETKEYNFWANYNPTYQTDWEGMKCWQYFEEATGVHINWTLYSNRDEMNEKRSLLFAAGDMNAFPDAFFRAGVTDAQLKQYGPDGMFMDLSELVKEYGPDITAAIDTMNAWSSVLDPETGAMYSLPSLSNSYSARMHPKLFLNTKMMENVGATEMPTTTDELYDLLVKVRDNDANGNGDATDEIGITSNYPSNVIRAFTGAFGICNRGRDELSIDADPADETKVRFTYTTDGYRKMLSYMNKLYEENLLDHDLFGVSTSNMVAKGSQDMIFGLSYTNISSAALSEDDYAGIDVALKGPDGDQQWNNLSSGIGTGNFVISGNVAEEDAINMIKWADNLYTEEGATMLYFGKEGVDFNYDENGYPTFTDELMSQITSDNPYDTVVSQITCYASGGVPGYVTDKTSCSSECRGVPLQAAEKMAPFANAITWHFNFTTEENEEVNTLRSDILTNCQEVYQAKFITGELDVDDDAVWQGYVDEINGLGVEDYLALYQTALDRMNAMSAQG